MSSAVLATPSPITPLDRLSLTLFFAVIAHAILVLGVSFVPNERPAHRASTLDVILVQHHSEKAPDKPDFLAQANREGGGESTEQERPATPFPAPFTGSKPEPVSASPPAEPSPATSEPSDVMPAHAPAASAPTPQTVLAQSKIRSKRKAVTTPSAKPVRPSAQPKPAVAPPPAAPTKTVNAAVLVSQSMAMAALSAELDQRLKAYASRPKRKWISAKTKEYKYASYMEAWRLKVERIGNLNYPDQARRRKLSGSLLLDVAINADGTINETTLRRSSGYRALDDAAMRIVKLAAPFAPLPKDIRAETDILHIERTWQFLRNNRLASP